MRFSRRHWCFGLASILFLGSIFLVVQLVYQNFLARKKIKALMEPAPTLKSTSPVQFDFYTVLPKMKVDTIAKTAAPAASVKGRYVLRAASFQRWEDAEQLRDLIQSWGFSAFIHHSLEESSANYQVIIGPYASLESAQRAQETLRTHKTESAMLKLQ
jgi:cell division protein FtsN